MLRRFYATRQVSRYVAIIPLLSHPPDCSMSQICQWQQTMRYSWASETANSSTPDSAQKAVLGTDLRKLFRNGADRRRSERKTRHTYRPYIVTLVPFGTYATGQTPIAVKDLAQPGVCYVLARRHDPPPNADHGAHFRRSRCIHAWCLRLVFICHGCRE
jgi:hypothetical protein